MDLMYIIVMVIFVCATHKLPFTESDKCSTPANATVSICDSLSVSSKTVYLSGEPYTVNNCFCEITLLSSKLNPSVRIGQLSAPLGCDYELDLIYGDQIRTYSCITYTDLPYDWFINNNTTITTNLRHVTNASFFAFCLNFSTDYGELFLNCNPPSTRLPSSTSSTFTSSSESPDVYQTDVTSPSVSTTLAESIIIGGSVGGTVLILIIIIIMVICIWKHRRENKRNPDKNQKSENISRNTLIIEENSLYVSLDVGTLPSDSPGNINDAQVSDQISPPIEYAVVKKSRGIKHANGTPSEINTNTYVNVNNRLQTELEKTSENGTDAKSTFIIGPHGDTYTVINKQ